MSLHLKLALPTGIMNIHAPLEDVLGEIVPTDLSVSSMFVSGGRIIPHCCKVGEASLHDDDVIHVEPCFDVTVYLSDDRQHYASICGSFMRSDIVNLIRDLFFVTVTDLRSRQSIWYDGQSARDLGLRPRDEVYVLRSVSLPRPVSLRPRLFNRQPGISALERRSRLRLLGSSSATSWVHILDACSVTVSLRVSACTSARELCEFIERYYGIMISPSDIPSKAVLYPNAVV